MPATRRLGYRLLGRRLDYLLLMRPRQWPILTAQLAVGVLLAPGVAGGGPAPAGVSPGVLLAAWLGWVVGLNGGTLAFNSAWDRDTADVAYLADPPAPPPGLAAWGLALMLAGSALAWAAAPALGLLALACTGLSVLYSHPRPRAKGIPGLDLVINMAGYGGGTTLAGLLAGATATGGAAAVPAGGWWLCAGFALLFGSLYPLTQIYQAADDRARGDRTLVLALGVRRSLLLALLLGAAAAPCLLAAQRRLTGAADLPLLAALAAWAALLVAWRRRADRLSPRDHARRLYRALALWAVVDAVLVAGRFL